VFEAVRCMKEMVTATSALERCALTRATTSEERAAYPTCILGVQDRYEELGVGGSFGVGSGDSFSR